MPKRTVSSSSPPPKPASARTTGTSTGSSAKSMRQRSTQATHASVTNSLPCHAFANTGTCRFGDRCRFSHNRASHTDQASSSSQTTSKRPCFAFLETGTCQFGDRCRYSHDAKLTTENSPSSSQTVIKRPCHTFANTGSCPFGEKCRFAHGQTSKPTQQAPSSSSGNPQASKDVLDFTTQLSRDVFRPKFTLPFDDQATRTLWHNAWAAVAVGANLTSARTLLRAYMRLPATTVLAPRAHHLLKTLSSIVEHSSEDSRNTRALVNILQLVADTIEHRLIPNHTSELPHLRPDFTALVDRLESSIRSTLLTVIADQAYTEIASRLLCRFLELLQRYSRILKTLPTSDSGAEQLTRRPTWADWQEATVGWLLRGAWLDAPQLHSSYKDMDSYAECLQKIVTMLTFYWGAGAIFPKCRHRGNDDRSCDQPLCAVCKGERRPPCCRKLPGGKLCSAPAKWGCSRRGHNAVCGPCLRDMQKDIVGKPGPHASTDIYDAVVERETVRRDGIVYVLTQLTSRKPPKINPNWKTTYRLTCSALVGVVRLGASCEPLDPRRRLELAEVVPVNAAAGIAVDFQERERGRLALRFLTKSDLSTLSGGMEALDNGARVAVIDMQVFVPEVLSVLSTVSDVEFSNHLNALPFSNALICQTSPRIAHSPLTKDQGIENAIAHALSQTEIDLVRRLSPSVKSSLVMRLASLVRSSNLDGTQLRAFLAALQKSLHCTQGPPGTGKSYLGVALIRALTIIRGYLEKNGISVGPIVVLSYKNHALDEILLDVVKGDGKHHWSFGKLIRCGKSDDERLNIYRERNSPAEVASEQVLVSRVATMRWVQRILSDWRSLRAALLMSGDSGGKDQLRNWRPSRHGAETNGLQAPFILLLKAVHTRLLIQEVSEDPSSEMAYNMIHSLSGKWSALKDGGAFADATPLNGLEANTEHWIHDGANRKLFLLENWLNGASPPPRCLASQEEGGCLLRSVTPGTYCLELHACLYEFGCSRRREEGTRFCIIHRCAFRGQSHEQCTRPRLRQSKVCESHACPRCIQLESPQVHSKELEASACAQHKCHSQGCGEVQMSDKLLHCSQHGCLLCREAAAEDRTDDVQSVKRFRGSQFCKEHKCIVKDCIQHRLADMKCAQDFCVAHACTFCDGRRNQVSVICARSNLCDTHRCSHMDDHRMPCAGLRLKESLYCDIHTCRICSSEGLSLTRTVVDYFPRNVCLLHPLCSYVSPEGNQCNQATGKRIEQYCKQHAQGEIRNKETTKTDMIKMRCHGITRKGKDCKSTGLVPKGTKQYYCPPHLSQEALSSSESEDDAVDDNSHSEAGQDQERVNDAFDLASSVDAPLIITKDLAPIPLSQRKDLEEDTKSDLGLSNTNRGVHEANVPANEASDEQSTGIQDKEPTVHGSGQCNYTSIQSKHNSDASNSTNEKDGAVDLDAGCERVSYHTNPDECEFQFTDEDASDTEVPDRIRHLREIDDNSSVSGSESDVESLPQAEENDETDYINGYSNDPREWTWHQPTRERNLRVAQYLQYICKALTKLVTIAESHVELARRERCEAASFVFRNARLVGATVVGATRRLQAIRASEPFAMIVEEACEVLEPTLVSVLAVRSLCKLELIGDHRQLPAFIQPCWFSIQTTHPTIKVSLFERLVLGSTSGDNDTDVTICSVLDIQRRMRPEICNLIRCEYDDVVSIVDDPCTISRRIGDSQKAGPLCKERELWCDHEQCMPGMQSQVFFWNLKTREGKAAVGLSRCNVKEAEACVNLIGWLLYCGLPPASISVITPYKGQRLTILKALRGLRGALPVRGKGRVDIDEKGVAVSTVDRYQGDENDVVILSLVCTKPGNRFVALRNRFIVASSRARLGFYIIGSTEALTKNVHGGDGPSHWRRLLRDLAQPEDKQTEIDEADTMKGVRLGENLNVCCPRHPESVAAISDPAKFPHLAEKQLGLFCSKPCPFVLPWCGHGCHIPCHSPRRVPHTSECNQNVQRPCDLHENEPLTCHQVNQAHSKSIPSLTDALKAYECEVMTVWVRPDCSHMVSVRCHDHKKLLTGDTKLPRCRDKVEDYVNPLCGHIIAGPECYLRRRWEDKPPRCEEIVSYKRPCGCCARISCYQSVHEASLDAPARCLEAVSRPRPRCTHLWSSRCFEAITIRELWLHEQGETITSNPPVVVQGTNYGPSETSLSLKHPERLIRSIPPCRIPTEYRLSCGHTLTVPCSEAFELAAGTRKMSKCTKETSLESPICGHQIRAPCYYRSLAPRTGSSRWAIGINTAPGTSQRMIDERGLQAASPLDQQFKRIRNFCSSSFSATRICGHVTENLPCTILLSVINSRMLPVCKETVDIERSCGHQYTTVCHRRNEPLPVCNESTNEIFVYPCGRSSHQVRPDTCSALTELRKLSNPSCPIEVPCVRFRCKHEVDAPCYLEKLLTLPSPGRHIRSGSGPPVVEENVVYCETVSNVAKCLEPVTYRRLCGHEETDIQCHLAFDWASSQEEAPPCSHEIELPSPLCDHPVQVPCHQESMLRSINFWGDIPCERITSHFDGKTFTCPVVEENGHVPLRPPIEVVPFLKCGFRTRLVRACGHEEDVPCEKIFERLNSQCKQVELEKCRECGHEVKRVCSKLRRTEEVFLCQNIVEKTCSLCHKNKVEVRCCKQTVHCNREVKADLPCGHAISWICGEDDPITDESKCLHCLKKQWNKALCEARHLVEVYDLAPQVDSESDETDDGSTFNSSFASLTQIIRDQAVDILPQSCVVSRTDVSLSSAKNLLSAYLDLLSCNVDVLSTNLENCSDETLDFSSPPNLLDASQSFDIVYRVLQREGNIEESFFPTETKYSRGTHATILSLDALKVDCENHSQNGSLSICVGAALRHRTLTNIPPFERTQRNRKREGKNFLKAEAKAKARLLMQKYRQAGFDHVADTERNSKCSRVYWIPGAVFPVLNLVVQLLVSCEICLEDMLPSKGWSCPSNHFLCRVCFGQFVRQAGDPGGGTSRMVDMDGNLLCPHDKCQAKYEEVNLLGQPHDATVDELKKQFEELQQLKMAAHAKNEVDAALQGQKAQLQAEFQRIMEIKDLDQRQAETLRIKIVDQVLTHRCPNCEKAFIDFDGCFALKCSNCSVNFCAWCIRHHTTGDVHRHVNTCPERSGNGLFHSQSLFRSHHSRRRKLRLIEILKRENPDVRKRVLKLLASDLQDLDIVIRESEVLNRPADAFKGLFGLRGAFS